MVINTVTGETLVQNTTGALFTQISGLHPFYTYRLSVAGFTVDVGPFSEELLITLPEDGGFVYNYSVVIVGIHYCRVYAFTTMDIMYTQQKLLGYNINPCIRLTRALGYMSCKCNSCNLMHGLIL